LTFKETLKNVNIGFNKPVCLILLSFLLYELSDGKGHMQGHILSYKPYLYFKLTELM